MLKKLKLSRFFISFNINVYSLCLMALKLIVHFSEHASPRRRKDQTGRFLRTKSQKRKQNPPSLKTTITNIPFFSRRWPKKEDATASSWSANVRWPNTTCRITLKGSPPINRTWKNGLKWPRPGNFCPSPSRIYSRTDWGWAIELDSLSCEPPGAESSFHWEQEYIQIFRSFYWRRFGYSVCFRSGMLREFDSIHLMRFRFVKSTWWFKKGF